MRHGTGEHVNVRLLSSSYKVTARSISALTQSRDALARATEGANGAPARLTTCFFCLSANVPAEMNAKFAAANAAVAEVSASDLSLK